MRPFGALYAYGTARRVAKADLGYAAKCPVICVGNINAGGTGKTPTTIALIQLLQGEGLRVSVVSRGFGGTLEGPVKVDPNTHSAAEVGDEPILISAFANVIVSKDRALGVKQVEGDADVVILDDGHQNPSVRKDLSIVFVDANIGFGNGATIPAGPLREPIAAGLGRANALLSIGDKGAQLKFAQRWGASVSVPHLRAHLSPLQTGMPWQGLRAVAFAGIAHPGRFFRTLRCLGVDLVSEGPLGDHQRFSPQLLTRLRNEARQSNAQLVTTEKDAARLPASLRKEVLTLPVRFAFEDQSQVRKLLAPILS